MKSILFTVCLFVSYIGQGFGISESLTSCSSAYFNPIEHHDSHYMMIRSVPGSYTVFSHEYDGIYLNTRKFCPVYIQDGDKLIVENKVYTYYMNVFVSGRYVNGWFDANGSYASALVPKNKPFYLYSLSGCKIAINNS